MYLKAVVSDIGLSVLQNTPPVFNVRCLINVTGGVLRNKRWRWWWWWWWRLLLLLLLLLLLYCDTVRDKCYTDDAANGEGDT